MITSRRAEPDVLAAVGRRLMPAGREPLAQGSTDRYPHRRRTVANRGLPQPASEAARPFDQSPPSSSSPTLVLGTPRGPTTNIAPIAVHPDLPGGAAKA